MLANLYGTTLQSFLVRGACAATVAAGAALAVFAVATQTPAPGAPPQQVADTGSSPAPSPVPAPAFAAPAPLPALRPPPAHHVPRPVARSAAAVRAIGRDHIRHPQRVAALPPPAPTPPFRPGMVVAYPPPDGPTYYAYYPRPPGPRGWRYAPAY